MSPNILEYENGRIRVTANAYLIPELKNILDKFDNDAEPYLAYVHLMTAIDSPYINIPEDEKRETITYDIHEVFSDMDFDPDEELLDPAIEKLKSLFTSTLMNYYESMKISIEKMSRYLRNSEITEGRDGNLSEIIRIHKEAGSTIRSFKDIERQVDEEIKIKTRGDVELGDY